MRAALLSGEKKGRHPPRPPISFFRPLLKTLISSASSNHIFREGSDIYGRAPTAKANIMSLRWSIHIILPLFACGEE